MCVCVHVVCVCVCVCTCAISAIAATKSVYNKQIVERERDYQRCSYLVLAASILWIYVYSIVNKELWKERTKICFR